MIMNYSLVFIHNLYDYWVIAEIEFFSYSIYIWELAADSPLTHSFLLEDILLFFFFLNEDTLLRVFMKCILLLCWICFFQWDCVFHPPEILSILESQQMVNYIHINFFSDDRVCPRNTLIDFEPSCLNTTF